MDRDFLVQSFQEYEGYRGTHFYTEEGCRFLLWDEVIQFIDSLPKDQNPEFSEKLLSALANYDPESEFLALGEIDGQVSIEIYAKNPI